MNINPFLQCLGATGINTGVSILGLYSFASGDNLLAFNQIFPTGFHYINGIPYNDALPMIFNGFSSNSSGLLSGNSFYQISDIFTNDFSAIIYLNYSGCLNSGNENSLLMSTSNSSGAYLGITPSNRIFVQTPDYSFTISKEIGVNDFVYFNVVGGRFVNAGLYSMEDNTLYSDGYDEGRQVISVTDLYIGGALNYPATFTGYSGKINEIYLFSGALSSSVSSCVNCSFATGSFYSQTSFPYTTIQVTGSYWTGVTAVQTTGINQILTSYPKVNGGTGYVYVDSGITGNVTTNQILVPLTSNVMGADFTSGLSFLFNNAQMMSGMVFDFYFFNGGLFSGDVVEIYTYSGFNKNFGFPITNLLNPLVSNTQIYSNGLAETLGVDYTIAFNRELIGFDSNDILQYDIYPTTYTMPYTTGYIQTGTTGINFVNITGVSGIVISGFNYDMYLNGQKMASGVNYSYSGSTLTVSGNDLSDINDLSGDFLEIKFIPLYSNLIAYSYELTGNQNYISGISGFSEQVWVNGMRQLAGFDYLKVPCCRFCTSTFNNPNYQFSLYTTISTQLDSGMVFQPVVSLP